MVHKTVSRVTQTALLLATLFVLAMPPQATASETGPKDIPPDVSCGKCGMFPAKYPQWQTQIVFKDGAMTPFDGSKCMFGFMFNMQKFDSRHSRDDIAAIWARDFNTGEWINARKAHYVVGSSMMGPMGKELIPFGDGDAARVFQKEHGGELAMFDSISMATLKPLMGKMHHKGMKDMKMDGGGHGNMKMNGSGHMMNK